MNTLATRRLFAAGAVCAYVIAAYVIVALATLGLSGHRLLPLFEGVGPPVPYRWVSPPAAFAAGNVTPKAASTDIVFSAGKTGAVVPSTPDGQFLVNFAAGAFPPHDGDTQVHATITPLDPATLGPLPSGLNPDGNGYRIELTYQPSGTPADKLAGFANVIQTGPQPAVAFFYSADGRTWTKLIAPSVGSSSSLGANFTAAGWFLLGTTHTAQRPATGGSGTVLIAVWVALGGAVLGVIGLAFARRRRSGADRTPPRPSPQSRSNHIAPQKGGPPHTPNRPPRRR